MTTHNSSKPPGAYLRTGHCRQMAMQRRSTTTIEAITALRTTVSVLIQWSEGDICGNFKNASTALTTPSAFFCFLPVVSFATSFAGGLFFVAFVFLFFFTFLDVFLRI